LNQQLEIYSDDFGHDMSNGGAYHRGLTPHGSVKAAP